MANGAAQGTEEWLRERAGFATASCFDAVLARGKNGKEARTRANYRTKLVTERLIQNYIETYRNTAMEWGTRVEPEARAEAEAKLGIVVETSPFVPHPTIPWCGASPDGLIGSDGLIQIKCPYVSTVHVESLDKGVPSEHRPQIQGEMWVTGRAWSLFASYDPRMPPHLRLHTVMVKRDPEYIKTIEDGVIAFLAETHTMYERLLKMANWESA